MINRLEKIPWFVLILLLTTQLQCSRDGTDTAAATKPTKTRAATPSPKATALATPTALPLDNAELAPAKPSTPVAPSPQPSLKAATESKTPKRVKPRLTKARKITIATLREIGDPLLEKWQEQSSISATLNTTFDRKGGDEMIQVGKGYRDLLKKGHQILVRSYNYIEFKVKNMKSDDPAYYLTAERINKWSDGEFVYTHREKHEYDRWTKTLAQVPNLQYFGGPPLLRQLIQIQFLQRLPDKKFNGHLVYELQGWAVPKKVKVTFLIAKKTGLLIHIDINNLEQKVVMSIALSDIQYNVKFPEDHFVFTLPEDAEIEDLTR